jgi:hypothetical protein
MRAIPMATMTGTIDVESISRPLAQPQTSVARLLTGVGGFVLRRVRALAWRILDLETTFEPVDG